MEILYFEKTLRLPYANIM